MSDIQTWSTYPVAGIDIAALSPEGAANLILAGMVKEIHLCNTYTLSEVDRDHELRAALERSDLNLPDGVPIAWLGRDAGVSSPVRGPDLVLGVMRAGVAQGVGHYLYGGAPGVADRMRDALTEMIEGVRIVGCEAPPYTPLDDTTVETLARRVQSSGADVVWIGLGTPKQDYLVRRLAVHTDAALVPVGAAFNFISGSVPEAPMWLRGSGWEWLYRLIQEPRRLWRRYFFGGPRFVISAIRHCHHTARST